MFMDMGAEASAAKMKPKLFALLIVITSLSLLVIAIPVHANYVSKQGDYFTYHETADVNNGQGSTYTGYTDHTVTDGTEKMNTVYGNGTVASHYNYAWTWNDNQGSPTKTGSSAGNFTWSSKSFYYVRGNDSQIGYVNPLHVWYYMNSSQPLSATFYLLNTQMSILDKNYSYQLPSQNGYVQSIYAQGKSSYYRNDAYGKFTASYTWSTYSDPSTGYIIGYTWVEQDSDSSGNGFTYTENLYVTAHSYTLATAAAPPGPGLSSLLYPLIAFAAILLIIIIIVIVAVVARRRRGLPQHAYDYSRTPTPYAPPAPQTINLEPKQPPAQQIVIKEVAKVKCKYCGALVDTTALVCPICGGATT